MNPQIHTFNLDEKAQYLRFRKKYASYSVVDLYQELMTESHLAHTPSKYFSEHQHKKAFAQEFYESHIKNTEEFACGAWVIFDCSKELLHLPLVKDLLLLRTLRNRNLITEEEQLKVYHKKIAIAGLSVGSNVLISLVRTGIGNHFKIADFDVVSALNMNRAHFFLNDINKPKVEVIGQMLYKIDPYIAIDEFSRGLSDENIGEFIKDSDLIIDAFDNFEVKLSLRRIAKSMQVPVLSGFDIEMGSLVILERYDIEPNLSFDFYLNGVKESQVLSPTVKPMDKTNLFINIIGRKYHSKKMLDSVLNVGHTLTGYPQLSIATNLTSALWTNVSLDFLLGRNKKSFRSFVQLN